MEQTLQPLVDRMNLLSDRFRELRDGVQKAIRIADDDPEMALTRARKVLEYVIRDVFERRVKEPAGSRPLENLLGRLVKDGYFPVRLDAYANTVRKLGNVGTHNFRETITAADVYQSLTQLMPILDWYFAEERPEAGMGPEVVIPREEPIAAKPAAKIEPGNPDVSIAVVPKGLRAFDATDSDFFLQLLPGARDKDGLPESLRFWKHRIEASDELTFAVGVIYGPSGCGKTSLIKAGLLPRLSSTVASIYVEATAADTEGRLLKGLRRRFPTLPNDIDLPATIIALRQGQLLESNQKVLIVLDQFEQWLHAKRQQPETELAQALRQCDGERVQGLLLVRDDFWVALSRFMAELHVELVEGHNVALADLFDLRHAKKVLSAFGQAFGALADRSAKDYVAFIEQAVAGLAEDGRVISVRLALFAEMVKSKPWTLETLKAVGGTQGVGVVFLEETFGAANANSKHRLHQQAARAVLKALLPDSGTDIKGNMRSDEELLQASGYADRRADFESLIRILDSEVRLITPTDPGGVEADSRKTDVERGRRYYQLTHDYLVHSLRQWLTQKQRETRRGRAELRLAERSSIWNSNPVNRYLPAPIEFLKIRLLTDKRKWTEAERKMMAQAAKMHGIVWACVAALWLVLILGGTGVIAYQAKIRETQTATLLVDQLLAVEGSKVPAALEELASYRPWAEPVLRKQYADAQPQSRARLRLALALLPVDDTKVAELLDQLSSVHPGDFAVVRDALLPYQASLVEPLWKLALDTTRKEQPRFQAACALATYAPTDARWNLINKFVAGRLVTRESSAVVIWRSTLQPAKAQLVGPLTSIFRNPARKEAARTYAAGSLVYYAADEPEQLFNLLADSEPFQFPVVFEALYMHTEEAIGLAKKELAKRPPEKASEDEKESLARRQANSAVALYRLGDTDQIWPMLTFTPDPRVRSYLVHWFGPLGGDLQAVVQRLETERDVSIRRALVLMLGEFSKSQLATLPREPLLEKLLSIYENEPDAGLHGAVEWLLRQWGQGSMLASLADKLKVDDAQLRARPASDKRRWYVNTQRQTFVMVDGHDFLLGSPDSEPDHLPQEHQYRCELNRRFAISEYEITKSQYRAFQREVKTLDLANSPELTDVVRTDDSPQTLTTWYEAAHYCNWLSKQEGIPREQWCYEPNKRGAYRAGMKAKKGYLKLTGYRLPTEAEWEFVCRAETLTSRYYGFAESLLPQYAWYQSNSQNRTWPVGTLKPNDFGLFDLLGNALEWCFDGYEEHPGQASGTKDSSAISIDPAERRVLRGGALNDLSPIVRSATRYYLTPENRYYFIGFRPARTLP